MNRRIVAAPMMGYTHRYFRLLLRLISRKTLLFGEMIKPDQFATDAGLELLAFSRLEHPLVAQLSGNQPQLLAGQARRVQDLGYDEVNLNVGCPGRTVTAAGYGASLIAKPRLVAQCIEAMKRAVTIPVTIKTRIGIEGESCYERFEEFLETNIAAGCDAFYVHARNAILSPDVDSLMNRTIPPLDYNYSSRFKGDHPDVPLVVNGGITTATAVQTHLRYADGVMLGRVLLDHPFFLREVDDCWRVNSAITLQARCQTVKEYLWHVSPEIEGSACLDRVLQPLRNAFIHTDVHDLWQRQVSCWEHIPSGEVCELIEAVLDHIIPPPLKSGQHRYGSLERIENEVPAYDCPYAFAM